MAYIPATITVKESDVIQVINMANMPVNITVKESVVYKR